MNRSSESENDRRSELLRKWEKHGELSVGEYEELRELSGAVSDDEAGGMDTRGSALDRFLRRDVPDMDRASEQPQTDAANAATVNAIMDQVRDEARSDPTRRFGNWWHRAGAAGVAAAGLALLIGAAALFIDAANLAPGAEATVAQESAEAESVDAGTTVDTLVEGDRPSTAAGAEVVVRFELVAPEANSVSLVGDFNNWSEEKHVLQDRDNDGVWEVEVPLERGEVYTYNFLINDNEWIPDPRAVNHIEDSFGGEKSVLNL
ncbi:MAG: hypothetical protein GVY29_00675 [Spirochaetes bacterium]|jgi:hypothetical protein|nr:hypothetical protein [Spirochaetota bacterium]